jgi:hypothetical protein
MTDETLKRASLPWLLGVKDGAFVVEGAGTFSGRVFSSVKPRSLKVYNPFGGPRGGKAVYVVFRCSTELKIAMGNLKKAGFDGSSA